MIVVNLTAAAMVLALLLVRDARDIWVIYAVMVLYGAAGTLIGSAQSALLTVMLRPERLGAANAALQMTREGLRVFAPLVGASLFAAFGAHPVVLLDALSFLVAAASLLMIRVDEPALRPSRQRWGREVMAGLTHIRHSPVLRQLALAVGVAVLVVGFIETAVFAVVDTGLHRPPTFLGVLSTVQGAGAIAAGLVAAPTMRRIGGGPLVAVGLILFAAGAAMLALPWLPLVLTGCALLGGGLAWINVGFATLIQRWTPARLQGRVYSAMDTAVATPQSVSIAIGAGLVTLVDYRLELIAMGVVVALCGIYLLSRPAQRQAPPADLPDSDSAQHPPGPPSSGAHANL